MKKFLLLLSLASLACKTQVSKVVTEKRSPVLVVADSLRSTLKANNEMERKKANKAFENIALQRIAEFSSNPVKFLGVKESRYLPFKKLNDKAFTAHFSMDNDSLVYDVIAVVDSNDASRLNEGQAYQLTGSFKGFFGYQVKEPYTLYSDHLAYTDDVDIFADKIELGTMYIDSAHITF